MASRRTIRESGVTGEDFVINRQTILRWGGALLIALLFFYGLDLAIMAAQGLPLNLNLTPAQ